MFYDHFGHCSLYNQDFPQKGMGYALTTFYLAPFSTDGSYPSPRFKGTSPVRGIPCNTVILTFYILYPNAGVI